MKNAKIQEKKGKNNALFFTLIYMQARQLTG